MQLQGLTSLDINYLKAFLQLLKTNGGWGGKEKKKNPTQKILICPLKVEIQHTNPPRDKAKRLDKLFSCSRAEFTLAKSYTPLASTPKDHAWHTELTVLQIMKQSQSS